MEIQSRYGQCLLVATFASVTALGARAEAACALDASGMTICSTNHPTTGVGTGHGTNSPDPDEITGSKSGADWARTLIAAGMMGARFYGGANVNGMEESLLGSCQARTIASSTWPEKCNLGALIDTLRTTFNQNWVEVKYAKDVSDVITPNQDEAIRVQINALKSFGSPSIVPLYGRVDHWGTIFEIHLYPDQTIKRVVWYDGGSHLFDDSDGNPYADSEAHCGSTTWRLVYFRILDIKDPADPYREKYVLSYDPPPGASLDDKADIDSIGIDAEPEPGVLTQNEVMTAAIAQERVWDALLAAHVDEDRAAWPIIEKATAGGAFEVHGTAPSGEPWEYYLVPLFADGPDAVAMVQLAAEDGAFQQVWTLRRPLPWAGVPLDGAASAAYATLAEDEVLWGGELTWDPRSNHRYASTPMLPYYEFHVAGEGGGSRGIVVVPLHDGIARRLPEPLASPSETP